MPPKKKKAGSDPAKLADKESLLRAEAEIVSLQRQLELQSHESLLARRSERVWRDKCSAFSDAVAKQREDTLDITADIMRKYKLLQDHSSDLVKSLEGQVQELTCKLNEQAQRAEKAEHECASVREKADKEVKLMREKMDGMRLEFADMLKLTIDKMHVKLELAYAGSS